LGLGGAGKAEGNSCAGWPGVAVRDLELVERVDCSECQWRILSQLSAGGSWTGCWLRTG